jgi:hypothetical protein
MRFMGQPDRHARNQVSVPRFPEEELVHPELYKDLDRARVVGQQARDLRTQLDGLHERWTEASVALETAEAEAAGG